MKPQIWTAMTGNLPRSSRANNELYDGLREDDHSHGALIGRCAAARRHHSLRIRRRSQRIPSKGTNQLRRPGLGWESLTSMSSSTHKRSCSREASVRHSCTGEHTISWGVSELRRRRGLLAQVRLQVS